MGRKQFLMITLTGCLLLSGCGNTTKTVETSSEKELLTETIQGLETHAESSEKAIQKLSERNMDDFIFSGEYFVDDQHYYRGEIIDEAVKNGLWDLVCSQEDESVIEGGTASIGRGSCLMLTDKKTEEIFYIGYAIWYSSPEVCGGPLCFIIASSTGEKVYYGTGREDTDIFDNLMTQGVVCEENIIKE